MQDNTSSPPAGFVDAAAFGFAPDASGEANTAALQKAVDQTGTIVVSRPGTYDIAGTVLIGSNTTLIFGNNVFLKKVADLGAFTHVILNKGALTRIYDPGARVPRQEQLIFDNIRVLHDQQTDFLSINTPVDVVTIANSSFRNNRIHFHGNQAMPDYFKTVVNLYGCVFNHAGPDELIVNSLPGKEVPFRISANVELRKGC